MIARGIVLRILLLAAATATSGCDLVYPWSSGSPPGVPQRVRAELTSFDTVDLTWAPQDGIGAYEVATRVAGGAWTIVGRAPGSATRAVIDASGAPEAVELGFRVRAYLGDLASGWSAEAVVARGLRPASAFRAVFTLWPTRPGTPVQLDWQRGSTAADTIVVERRAVRAGIETAPWVRLADVAVADTSWIDPDTGTWLDGSRLEYRLRYALGTLESDAVTATTDAATLLPPAAIAASGTGGLAVHVSWTPASQAATQQVVQRAAWPSGTYEDVATLGPTAAAWDDTVPAAGGYLYVVVARAPGYAEGASAVALAATPVGPLHAASLTMPNGDPVDRDAQGRFTAVVDDPSGARAYLPDGVHDVAAFQGRFESPPYLRAADGTVHLLYALVSSAPAGSAGHDWRGTDGTWHSDVLPIAPEDAAIDPAGALHLVVCIGGTHLTYATNRSGAWVTEEVPPVRFAEDCAIAIGPDGEPRIAYTVPRPVTSGSSSEDDVGLLAHGTSGWQDEAVPVGAAGIARYPDLFRLLPVAGGVTLLLDGGGLAVGQIDAYDRAAGGWSGPVRIVDGPTRLLAAASSDGARVALAWPGYGYAERGGVAVRDGTGPWTVRTLLSYQTSGVGFDPAGKLWVAQPQGPGAALVYEER